MAVSKKGKRKMEYDGNIFYWFVRKNHLGISEIHILSEDKKINLEDVKNRKRYLRYKAKLNQIKSEMSEEPDVSGKLQCFRTDKNQKPQSCMFPSGFAEMKEWRRIEVLIRL